MANLEVVEASTEAAPAAKTAKFNKLIPLAIIAGSAVVGVALGIGLLAPRFAKSPGGGEPAAAVKHEKKSHGGGHGSVIEIDNIVVNPAGAEGTHYVMATVAVEVADKKLEEYLRANEHVVKDIVMSTMGRETMEMLRQPGARDVIKANIAQAVGEFIDDPEAITIYLPEFVVQ